MNIVLVSLAIGACGKAGDPEGVVSLTIEVDGDLDRAEAVGRARVQTVARDEGAVVQRAEVQRPGDRRLTFEIAVALRGGCGRLASIQRRLVHALGTPGHFELRPVLDGEPVGAVAAALRKALPAAEVAPVSESPGALDVRVPDGTDLASALAQLPRPEGAEIALQAAPAVAGPGPGRRRLWVVAAPPALDEGAVAAARIVVDDFERPDVEVTLDEAGTRRFDKLTERLVGKHLAVLVDGAVVMAPRVMERISGGKLRIVLASLPDEALPEAQDLVTVLSSGALADRVTVEQVRAACVPAE